MVPTQYGCDCFCFFFIIIIINTAFLRKTGEPYEVIHCLRGGFEIRNDAVPQRQKSVHPESFLLLLSGLRRGLSQSQLFTLVSTMLFCSWQQDTSSTHLLSFVKWVSWRTSHIYQRHHFNHVAKSRTLFFQLIVSLSLTTFTATGSFILPKKKKNLLTKYQTKRNKKMQLACKHTGSFSCQGLWTFFKVVGAKCRLIIGLTFIRYQVTQLQMKLKSALCLLDM